MMKKFDGIKNTLNSLAYSTSVIRKASTKFFILKIVLSVVAVALPYAPLFLWRYLLNALVTALSGGGADNLINMIWVFCGLYCAVLAAEQLLKSLQSLVDFKYQDQISYYLDNIMVEKVSGVELAFYDSSTMRDTLDHSWQVLNSVQSMVWSLSDIFQTFARMIVSLVMLANFSLWVVPAIIVLCIPSALGSRRLSKREYEDEKKFSLLRRKQNYFKYIFFGSIRLEIKIYGLTEYFLDKYRAAWQEKHNEEFRRRLFAFGVQTLSLLLLTASELIVYGMSVVRLAARKIEVGDVTYYVSLATGFRQDFAAFFTSLDKFSKQQHELDDVRKFLEFEPTLEEFGTLIPSECPEIEFRNVSFKYPGAEDYVLRDCSFKISPGETVGLVGLNGSGKSTIVKLILRFYDPCEGEVLLDGVNAKEYDAVALRRTFGVLFQDYSCYSLSARENIAMSDIDRKEDDAAIWEACRKSRADEYISTWKRGLDEPMTRKFEEDGKDLSGGQWQRLALARAFFRKAGVMLLDEPSAALDALAEHEIFLGFTELASNRSAVMISHRLSSITLCNRIIILDGGRIIEEGSHEELMALNGKYAHLFKLQAEKYQKEHSA